MLLDADRIAGLIPHSGRMCLLNGVLSWDRDTIRCTANSHRDEDNPLRRGGHLSATCGIEYAAQAMALHGALSAADGAAQRPGLLASVRDLRRHAFALDECHGDLTIEARLLLSEGNRMIYAFSVSCADRTLIEGRSAVVLGEMV